MDYTQIKDELTEKGFIHLKNIKKEKEFIDFCLNFGKPLEQYNKEKIDYIEVDITLPEGIYSASSSKELDWHTECSEFDSTPPKFIALWCIKQSQIGGETELLNLKQFINDKMKNESNELSISKYKFNSTPGLIKQNISNMVAIHPMIENKLDHSIFRLSRKCMMHESDKVVEKYYKELDSYSIDNTISIHLKERELLLWNNHIIAHKRTDFTDNKRKLCRLWLE